LGVCTKYDQLLHNLLEKHPGILIVEMELVEIGEQGILSFLRREKLSTRTVVLTHTTEILDAVDLIQHGAMGIFSQNASSQELLACLAAVSSGSRWIHPDVAKHTVENLVLRPSLCDVPLQMLTARERDIVHLVCLGLRNREIAHELHISEGTVKLYLHAIFKKLGVRSRTELILKRGDS
jgi:two-component system, NarL family, nitrate/nitrite response regulator NarL